MHEARVITARPHRLFQPVVERVGELYARGERIILLVPEQLTLEAERELMKRLKLEGFFNIDVLSPSRLCERVLDETGRDSREPLTDAGRRMAISQTLEQLGDSLHYYGSTTHRRGFVEKLSALITDMKRGELSVEMLRKFTDSVPEGLTKHKLNDLCLIYERYEQFLMNRFSDGEDRLEYVASRFKRSAELGGSHMFVYGFDTLPEQLMRLLCAAAPVCLSLTVALVCDSQKKRDGDLFLPVRQGIARFGEALARQGISIKIEPLPDEPLLSAPDIRHVDEELFTLSPGKFNGNCENIYYYSGLSPFEEATLMSRQVLRLIREGADIERIAVLAPEGGDYDFAVSAALRLSGIMFFADRRMPAASHGLTRYLMSALRAAANGYRNEDVIGMIKSGFSPLTFEEGCELENYSFCYGINMKRWTQPFTRGDEAVRQRCEELRQRLMEPLMRAREGIVSARNAAESMTAVFNLLKDVDAYNALMREEERLVNEGMLVRAGQNSQIWQALLSLMDELVRLEGNARVPLKHIAERLECGISAVTLKALPPASGMLHAGALGHALNIDADYVFLLGLSDGILKRETDSLLTDEERAAAQEATGCHLGLTDMSRSIMARLDMKTAMTLPKRGLFMSYSKTSASGEALRPATLLSVIQQKMFGEIKQSPVPVNELPMSAAQAVAELGILIRAYADGVETAEEGTRRRKLIGELLANSDTAPIAMRVISAPDRDNGAKPITPEEARALYGDETLSVSRLEEFASCPFKHFVDYGLRPIRLREWKVDPIETGNFFHAGLNAFSKLARKEPSFPQISEKRTAEIMDEAVEPIIAELMQGPMGDGERSLKRFELARNALTRAGTTIVKQLSAGSFNIYDTEASFGYERGLPPILLKLSDGREIMLRGRIDRIDRYDAPETVYLRVIDYKSSQKKLEAANAWWGLQLQLLLYLDVCTAAIPGSKPAGAFYFYVADPIINSPNDAKEFVEEKLRSVLTLKGITLCELEVIEAMDAGETPCVLPPIFLKSGQMKKDAHALSLNQMQALIRHARDTATELANGIFGGKTDIEPVRSGETATCSYCDFKSICRFDSSASDAPFRELPKMGMDDMREQLDAQN